MVTKKRSNKGSIAHSDLIMVVQDQLEQAWFLLKERHGEDGWEDLSEDFIKREGGFGFYPEDTPVKEWYITTVAILQGVLGKTDSYTKRFMRIEKDHTIDSPFYDDAQFNTGASGPILRDGLEILNNILQLLKTQQKILEPLESTSVKPMETGSVRDEGHADKIPTSIWDAFYKFKEDYPEPKRVAFIMMQFTGKEPHNRILQSVQNCLRGHNIIGVRADSKEYSDDLFLNVMTYLHGCEFGIAVFDRIIEDDVNPNVSLEVGYMLGMGKPICLLKDYTIPSLQTDLAGKLYKEFDPHDPENTIPPVLEKWLKDKALIGT